MIDHGYERGSFPNDTGKIRRRKLHCLTMIFTLKFLRPESLDTPVPLVYLY